MPQHRDSLPASLPDPQFEAEPQTDEQARSFAAAMEPPDPRPAPLPRQESPESDDLARRIEAQLDATPHARFTTTQSASPVVVGTTRGLIVGVVLALLAGAGAAVAVLLADGTDRAALLGGLGVGIANLIAVVSAFGGFGYADASNSVERL